MASDILYTCRIWAGNLIEVSTIKLWFSYFLFFLKPSEISQQLRHCQVWLWGNGKLLLHVYHCTLYLRMYMYSYCTIESIFSWLQQRHNKSFTDCFLLAFWRVQQKRLYHGFLPLRLNKVIFISFQKQDTSSQNWEVSRTIQKIYSVVVAYIARQFSKNKLYLSSRHTHGVTEKPN